MWLCRLCNHIFLSSDQLRDNQTQILKTAEINGAQALVSFRNKKQLNKRTNSLEACKSKICYGNSLPYTSGALIIDHANKSRFVCTLSCFFPLAFDLLTAAVSEDSAWERFTRGYITNSISICMLCAAEWSPCSLLFPEISLMEKNECNLK